MVRLISRSVIINAIGGITILALAAGLSFGGAVIIGASYAGSYSEAGRSLAQLVMRSIDVSSPHDYLMAIVFALSITAFFIFLGRPPTMNSIIVALMYFAIAIASVAGMAAF